MAFQEIEKTRKGRNTGAPGAFTIDKKGAGSLRINRAGMEFIAQEGIGLKLGDMVKLFHDGESGKIALKKSKEGKFRLSKNSVSMDTLRISSKDLTELLKKDADYDMEKAQGYDLVLVPRM
jgi:bifunctional DNA-binding transcriptional regulator/antitoxin component of YhaV-PrlF toxin-antitoxin module